MKTLAREDDKAEILRRLRKVQPESAPPMGPDVGAPDGVPSGRFVPHGARPEARVRHLHLAAERTILKWFVLYAPLRVAGGNPDEPGDRSGRGRARGPWSSPPTSRELEALLELVTAERGRLDRQPHPLFGAMSDAAWLRWGYLHMDHHLRQFGA